MNIRQPVIHDINKIISSSQFPADKRGKKPSHIWSDTKCNNTLNSICNELKRSLTYQEKYRYQGIEQNLSIHQPNHIKITTIITLIKDNFNQDFIKQAAPKII